MPGTTLPVDQSRAIGELFARVERMERQTRERPGSFNELPPLVFTYPGPLDADVESPPWYPAVGVILLQIRVSLLANAGSNHVVEVRVDGSAVQQFTLTTGSKTTTSAIGININAGSYLTIKTITVADDDLSVEFDYRPR